VVLVSGLRAPVVSGRPREQRESFWKFRLTAREKEAFIEFEFLSGHCTCNQFSHPDLSAVTSFHCAIFASRGCRWPAGDRGKLKHAGLSLRGGLERFVSPTDQGRKSRCSCRIRLKFDSVAKLAECPNHLDCADSLGLFGHRGASLLIVGWDTLSTGRDPTKPTRSNHLIHLSNAFATHGRSTNLPRVWRNSICRCASRTSSRAKTPAIGTSNSPRATRSANSATTDAVAASAPPFDWTPKRFTASKSAMVSTFSGEA